MIQAESDPSIRGTLSSVNTPVYYSGRYLSTICPRCRHEHYALKRLEEVREGTFFERAGKLVLHEYRSDVPLFCQLCGVDISGSVPVDMLFGQPWHVIREKLPADLVADMETWRAHREPEEMPPSALVERLYRAYLKAKIDIFPR